MIAEIAVSLLAVLGFGLALWKFRIVPVAQKAVTAAMTGLSTMMDRELDDDAKETAVRGAAFALIGAALSIALRFAGALAIAALPILLFDALGLIESDAVLALMLRLDYILIVSVVAILAGEILRRRFQGQASETAPGRSGTYSLVDRFLHGMAFSSPFVLRFASRLETAFVSSAHLEPEAPIFITSLARGGTTSLLNALAQVPGIATHTYRDMPFLTAPVLWNRIAGGRRRQVTQRERAHGDGLTIDLDSPEAFEEVIWQLHWPEKYRMDRIDLWSLNDRDVEAERFLTDHMRKIVRARLGKAPSQPFRYCSKNNANIARLGFLAEAFPGCRIVVPLRRPETHAASLLRQHRNFLAQQAEDDFIRRYMRDIGHFEFGLNLRPMMFAGFDPEKYDPKTPDYWLDYWIHAFREVQTRLSEGQELLLVAQDKLRADPAHSLRSLFEALNLDADPEPLAKNFLSTPDKLTGDEFSAELIAEANQIYDDLCSRAK